MHVLVVDEGPEGRLSLRAVLEGEDHSVVEVGDVVGALRLVEREPFDAALVGLRLPEGPGAGLDLIGLLSAARPRLPTVLTAADASIEEAVEAIRRGAVDLLPRPATPEQVRRALARVGGDRPGTEAEGPSPPPVGLGKPLTLEAIEAEHIRRVLGATPSLNEAAEILGIDPSTLYRKRKRLGL